MKYPYSEWAHDSFQGTEQSSSQPPITLSTLPALLAHSQSPLGYLEKIQPPPQARGPSCDAPAHPKWEPEVGSGFSRHLTPREQLHSHGLATDSFFLFY